MKIDISNLEKLDGESILEIKKLNNGILAENGLVQAEFLKLNPGVIDLFTKNGKEIKVLYLELAKVNRI